MKLDHWLRLATKKLNDSGIKTARLDCLVLLEDELGRDRGYLLAHPETEISGHTANVLSDHIARRMQHEPLAYIRGKVEFYGRDFIVSPAVLVPRPESETIISLLKGFVENQQIQERIHERQNLESGQSSTSNEMKNDRGDKTAQTLKKDIRKPILVADIGTGSGALGISAQLEIPYLAIDLLDIDDMALKIAKSNVVLHATGNLVFSSNLLQQAPKNYDILLCNLPYVPDEYAINAAAKFEPSISLFGGPDGLELYRKLFDELKIVEKKPLYIIIENFPFQHQKNIEYAGASGYRLLQTDDFIQVFIDDSEPESSSS